MSVASPRPASPRVDGGVTGVDVNPDKVESLRQGRSPVVEEKIGELTADVVTRRNAHGHHRCLRDRPGHGHLADLRRHTIDHGRWAVDEIPRTGDRRDRCGPGR